MGYRPVVVAAGVTEWLVWYGLGLAVALIAAALLRHANRRAGTMAFRIATWALVGGVGLSLPLLLLVDASGFSYEDISVFLMSASFASIPVFVILILAVSILKVVSDPGFRAMERLRWTAGTIVVFVASAVCGWIIVTHV